MNSQLRQRLVGAVVLVALAVIFVPMLLDGDDSSMPAFGSNIPAKPGYHFEPLDIPPREAPSLEPKPAVIEREDASPVRTGPVAEMAPDGAAEGEKATDPADATSEREPEKAAVQAWAVQVGSFSESENALRLRDRLRAEAFEAFVEAIKDGEKSVYRVRIGPEATREGAEAVKKRVKAEEPELPALVMSHP